MPPAAGYELLVDTGVDEAGGVVAGADVEVVLLVVDEVEAGGS